MSFRLRPLSDRVIIIQSAAEDISKGGIIIPDNVKDKPFIGKVIAVGPGKWTENEHGITSLIPMYLKEGDTVYFGKFAAVHIELNNVEYLILREGDVLAVDDNPIGWIKRS